MRIRDILAEKGPALLDWAQRNRIAPSPVDGRRIRRIAEGPLAGDGFEMHVLGDSAPPVPFPTPRISLAGPTGDAYRQMLAAQGEYLRRPHRFGYVDARDVRFWPKFGVHHAKAGNFIDAYCSDAVLKNPKYEVPRLVLPAMPLSGTFPAGLFLVTAWYHNFYHWMVDILPRLALLKPMIGEGLPIVMPAALGDMRRNTLQMALRSIGCPDAQVLYLAGNAYRFDRAILPTRLSAPLDVTEAQRQFLRAMIPAEDAPQSPERIYVSRRDAAVRRIANEDAVVPVLEAFGFRTVVMTGKSLSEQAGLFRNAKVVVGHHGAGLANLAFCRPGTRAIEIFQDGHFASCFARMAQLGGLDYGFAVGRAEGGDTWLDPEQLRTLLTDAGL